jgi:hypothetical protein
MGRNRSLNKKPTPLTFLSKVGGPQSAKTGLTVTLDQCLPLLPLLPFSYYRM